MQATEPAPATEPASLYVPTPNERARQDFVLGIKLLVNGPMQGRVRREYAAKIAPAATGALGRAPAVREDVHAPLARTDVFREWATFTHASQSMMWAAVEDTAQRIAPAVASEWEAVRTARVRPLGSLELDPTLVVPQPIAAVEIHRQPGGYVADGSDQTGDGVLAGCAILAAASSIARARGWRERGPMAAGS
jgi:hypothetical protein